ncbi:MAG: DUF2242 domain-containing protein [Propionivibrio sp.]
MKDASYCDASCRATRPVRLRLLAMALSAALLAACNSTAPVRVYQHESFAPDTPFQYYSSHDPEYACEMGKRALLSQGYQLNAMPTLGVRADKFFLPTASHATKLTISLVCLPSALGAVMYANALETHFELKSSSSSAGMSVAGIGSLSMPWSAEKDTLVKTGEETITEPLFYQRLFELIKKLDE